MNVGHLKKGLLAVNFLLTGLVLWMGYVVVFGANPWNPPDSAMGSYGVEAPDPEQQAPSSRRISLYNTIVRHDIFDTAPATQAAAPAPQAVQEVVEPTRLNIKLKGTVVGNQHSYAIIVDEKTKREGIYLVEDSVQNATVVDIEKDRVLLMVNDRKESLQLFPDVDDDEKKVRASKSIPVRSAPAQRRRAVRQAPVSRLPGK